MNIEPIGYIHTDLPEKFGVPRQSGLVDSLVGYIIMEPAYRRAEAFRELGGFSHIWLIWSFSQISAQGWHMTVRPPRLGGNKRVGVFASRSPFRPNRLGLSCVRLVEIKQTEQEGTMLIVAGVDMADGTPIFDIKPYIPLTDCHADAEEGYTRLTKTHLLKVDCAPKLLSCIPINRQEALLGVLAHDPRPGYAEESDRVYGVCFAGFNVRFFVHEQTLHVIEIV